MATRRPQRPVVVDLILAMVVFVLIVMLISAAAALS